MQVDVLVVGSGGGGLVAALAAAAAGRKVLVIEKESTLGGSTAISGGQVWIPNNPVKRAAGEPDSYELGWQYLDSTVVDCGAATSPARKQAFLTEGAKMIDFLCAQGLRLAPCSNFPDYYASRPGGCAQGRAVEPLLLDGRKLGADYARINRRTLIPSLAIYGRDIAGLSNGVTSWRAIRAALVVAGRTLRGHLLGGKPMTLGTSLVGQLLLALKRYPVEVLGDTPLLRLVTNAEGRVTGAVILRDGRETTVEATHGVILAAGGFSRNAGMRAQYQPQVSGDWTHAWRGDQGDGIRAGMAIGAAVAQMDEAWWIPTFMAPDGQRHMCLPERAKPYSIIVDQKGERFFNECISYMEAGQKFYQRHAASNSAVPSWFIFDARHRRRYPFTTWPAGRTPQAAIDAGYLHRADTLQALAQSCGIDRAGLQKTVERYNQLCVSGRDEDFGRGIDPYDHHYGDPGITPNSTMGSIAQAPFYAVALYPGDIGTNGGLLCDEQARVLRADGLPIAGLYAAGNCTASVMGRCYPGPGATIGAAMAFGYIAGQAVS